MFGIPGELIITISAQPHFYSLYADGPFERKYFDRETQNTYLAYAPGTVTALYYTYPTHRAAALVRNDAEHGSFPGLSKKVRTLFQVQASKVDKLRRALARLGERHGGAFAFPDDFYTRMAFLITRNGKLNYLDLDTLAQRYLSKISSGD